MTGIEWVVDARGCEAARLGDPATIAQVTDAIVRDLSLHVVGAPRWHRFPGEGGVTALYLLSESHLAVHTFPEHGSLCLNLFCCRSRPDWPFAERLGTLLGATDVEVRRLERVYAPAPALQA